MTKKIKIAIAVLSVTIIVACLLQALPRYSQLQRYNVETERTDMDDVEETIAASEETISARSGSTADETDYQTTEEYRENNNRITALRERIRLLNDGLLSDLTDITKQVFNRITYISIKPDDDTLTEECRPYMTDSFYERFKDMKFESESYMVYDIKFSDLDKEDISAYVLTRSSKQLRFFVTFSFDPDKNYAISNISKI